MTDDNKRENGTLRDDELARVRPVVISVIGPTNEGKTSVLRTLTGDAKFGEVNALTGTTVRAEIQKVFYKGKTEILRLIDTPGFQMSGAILDRLEGGKTQESGGKNDFSLEAILAAIPSENVNFRHDQRAWNEVAECDIVIFVVNVAESPNAALLRDTLDLLAHVRKPIIALFNNVAVREGGAATSSVGAASSAASEAPSAAERFDDEWTEALRRRGIHLHQIYDAHRRRFSDEYELFEKIAVFLNDPLRQKAIRAERAERFRRETLRLDRSRQVIAEMAYDVALCRRSETNVPPAEKKEHEERLSAAMRDFVAEREHAAHRELLAIWDFNLGVLDRKAMSVTGDVAENDHIFGKKWTKHSGFGAKIGAAIGGGTGLLLDVALAGLSLGTGTIFGAGLGAALGGGVGGYYNFAYDQKEKKITLKPKKEMFRPLLARSIELVRRLAGRGKAMEDNYQVFLTTELPIPNAPEFFQVLDELHDRPDRGGAEEIRRFPANEAPEERLQTLARLAAALRDLLPEP